MNTRSAKSASGVEAWGLLPPEECREGIIRPVGFAIAYWTCPKRQRLQARYIISFVAVGAVSTPKLAVPGLRGLYLQGLRATDSQEVHLV